jgi:hypothetical protein
VGGFEVAAAHVGTEVRNVRIRSEVGGTCKVKSPWHPRRAAVMDESNQIEVAHSMERDTILFDTQAGHIYALSCGP